MPVFYLQKGFEKLFDEALLEELLVPHPEFVRRAAVAGLSAFDGHVIPEGGIGAFLGRLLNSVLPPLVQTGVNQVSAAQFAADAQAGDPEIRIVPQEIPLYQLCDAPQSLTVEQPAEIPGEGAAQRFSAYGTTPASNGLRIRANRFLLDLALSGYRLDIPEDADARREALPALAVRLTELLDAARFFPFVQINGQPDFEIVAPGDVPMLITGFIGRYVDKLNWDDVVDFERLHSLSVALGQVAIPTPQLPLEDLDICYTSILSRLRQLSPGLPAFKVALRTGRPAMWWMEGSRLRDPAPLDPAMLKRPAPRSGEHVVIIPTGLTDGGPPESSVNRAFLFPILLILSDLHIGQGKRDNTEELYEGLEGAMVELLDAWEARVTAHRRTYGSQCAYLVLNGDILDMWAADAEIGPDGGLRPDQAGLASGAPLLSEQALARRMDRILDAHPLFFGRIRDWAVKNHANFVIYVCGNHDDHLKIGGLGAKLAAKLGGSKAVFASEDVYFPQLRCFIEHGHRKDGFNSSLAGSGRTLGELLVSILINPVERGHWSVVNQLDALSPVPRFLERLGLSNDTARRFRSAYQHLVTSREVDPPMYRAIMGQIDNLDNAGLEDAVADFGGRELIRVNRIAADDADVCDLDRDIAALKGLWLRSEFQSFAIRLSGRVAAAIPPRVQTWLVNEVFATNQAEKLGFQSGRGLRGDPMRKIHIVGHTHQPDLTTPKLTGEEVSAQHVNTGTGQDCWTAHDSWQSDDMDLGPGPLAVEWSRDRLTAVPRSRYCLVTPVLVAQGPRLKVEAGRYRSLQASHPRNVATQFLHGGFLDSAYNLVLY
ncbi:MAG TPA: hypothetical protein VEA61_03645 [Allosphingosinicella sp.]|nr:hypothetical protein [Allosphingosinicella sp.]